MRLNCLSPLVTLNDTVLKSIKLRLQTTPYAFARLLWDSLCIKASFSKKTPLLQVTLAVHLTCMPSIRKIAKRQHYNLLLKSVLVLFFVFLFYRLISEILGSYIKFALATTTLEMIPVGTWRKSDLKEQSLFLMKAFVSPQSAGFQKTRVKVIHGEKWQ